MARLQHQPRGRRPSLATRLARALAAIPPKPAEPESHVDRQVIAERVGRARSRLASPRTRTRRVPTGPDAIPDRDSPATATGPAVETSDAARSVVGSTAQVGREVVNVAPARPRAELHIENVGNAPCWLASTPEVTPRAGARLDPGRAAQPAPPEGAIYAVALSDTHSTVLRIREGLTA